MNVRCFIPVFVLNVLAVGACGGKTPTEDTVAFSGSEASAMETHGGDASTFLSDAEFTTAVDESSMTSAAPVSTEFLPDTPDLFFLGKLVGLPAESEIEVRWTRATEGEPFHISRSSGSGNFTVLSHFSPKLDELKPDTYWVVVLVNGEVDGKRSFRIVNRRGGAMLTVKELKVALSVDDSGRAVAPSNSLPKGSKKIYASFFARGVEPGATIRVKWYRGEAMIEENDLESTGEKRYTAALAQKKPLSVGDYMVEVEILGDVFATRTFYVGDSSGSPVIEAAALGVKLGKNRMPQPAKTSFNPGTRSIKCGVQFAFVPEGARVLVKWISLVGGGEDERHVSETNIKKAGESSVSVVWNPGQKLAKGAYKALIVVNGVMLKELPFSVQ